MAIPKILGAQRDFSAGEIDVSFKRADDHPARQHGVRQLQNFRILYSGSVQNRPGRRALYPAPAASATRTERFTMSPGNVFDIVFSNGQLNIINSAGATVATFTLQGGGAGLPWATQANISQIVYAILGLSIYITYPGMRPQVVSWDGVSTWSIADYLEIVTGNHKHTLFYRISPQGIAIQPSATTGSVTVTASSALFTASWVGVRIRFVNRQLLITAFTNSTTVTATVEEPLPTGQILTFGVDPSSIYSIGDVVIGSVSTAHGLITAINAVIKTITVQVISGGSSISGGGGGGVAVGFLTTDSVVGPSGALTPIGVASTTPQMVTIWDDEVMNAFRGYPASCFVDQFRLGFCNFPSVPGAIGYSAINAPTDLDVGAIASNAIFVVAPDKVRVLFVVPGQESSEFVFCDKKIYYIPITPSNPLTPSTVSFQILSNDGAAQVQPRAAQELIFYVGAGGNSVMAIIAPGMTLRPFNTRYIGQFHTHLFNNVQLLAVQTADSTFTERYLYALNGDGSIVSGKYNAKAIETDAGIGWSFWSGGATVTWIAANGADILFTSKYFGTGICEILDDTQYLDAALLVNSLPTAFTPPGGKGPLWWIPSQTVTLMDQTTRVLGTYQIDANGFIVPQFNAGENLTLASLVAGQPWTSKLEPFVPDANPGTSVHQRMFKRRVSRMAVAVGNSTGFLMARLFSGPLTRTSPALGTIMNQRRVTAYNQDDNPTAPPPLREEVQRWRPLGRAFDPRVAVIKDVPGPLLIHEIGLEASI